MLQVLWIGLGGFIGAIMRFLISGGVQQVLRNSSFPFGTLAVNLLGSFIFGGLTILADQSTAFSAESKAFLFIGFLGAFTTFSTFGNDSFTLFEGGDNWFALLNIGYHIFLGVGAIWAGRMLGKSFLS